jgi:hypothetical protein
MIIPFKMGWWNELKFFTQDPGPDLHQMVHKSQKNISSPVMSKNLSGVPLRTVCKARFIINSFGYYDVEQQILVYI